MSKQQTTLQQSPSFPQCREYLRYRFTSHPRERVQRSPVFHLPDRAIVNWVLCLEDSSFSHSVLLSPGPPQLLLEKWISSPLIHLFPLSQFCNQRATLPESVFHLLIHYSLSTTSTRMYTSTSLAHSSDQQTWPVGVALRSLFEPSFKDEWRQKITLFCSFQRPLPSCHAHVRTHTSWLFTVQMAAHQRAASTKKARQSNLRCC